MSAKIVERSQRSKRVKCDASWVVVVSTSSSVGRALAVVSHRPGI